MGIALVHHLHTKIGAVDDVCPGIDDTALGVHDRLVEIESIEVECHSRNAHSCEPDSNHRPGSKEEMKSTGVVERGILEDKTTKVTVCGDDIVRFLLLAEFITSVGRLVLGGLADERRGDERAMHGREEGPTKDTGNPEHVEGMHQNVMLDLEDKHEVERPRNSKRHTVGE